MEAGKKQEERKKAEQANAEPGKSESVKECKAEKRASLIRKLIMLVLAAAVVATFGYGIYVEKTANNKLGADQLTIVEAPEQTESMVPPQFVKEEYVSVLPGGTNIAGDGKISSSGFAETYTERKAVDGNAAGASYWEGAADTYPNELTVTYKEVHTIHAVRIALNPAPIWGMRTQKIALQGLDADGNTIEIMPQADYVFDPDKGNEAIMEFDDTDVTAVSLVISDNTGASGGQVAEFEIYE